jgi:hypothetical protein
LHPFTACITLYTEASGYLYRHATVLTTDPLATSKWLRGPKTPIGTMIETLKIPWNIFLTTQITHTYMAVFAYKRTAELIKNIGQLVPNLKKLVLGCDRMTSQEWRYSTRTVRFPPFAAPSDEWVNLTRSLRNAEKLRQITVREHFLIEKILRKYRFNCSLC